MPKDEVPSEDGMNWLASQLGDGARPALPDEYAPRQSPRWPRTSRIVPPAPVVEPSHTGVFLWGLKPTSQPDPRLAKAAARAAAEAAAAVIPAAPVPSSVPSSVPSTPTGSVPTTTAALFVVTPANPARAAAAAVASAVASSAAAATSADAAASSEPTPAEPTPAEPTPAGPASPSASEPGVPVSEPLPPVEAPAPLMVSGGPDEVDRSGSIRSQKADPTPTPWWATLTQSPLELTAEEVAAADLLAGRTPPAAAPAPAPRTAPVSARGRLRARVAASLSTPAPLAGRAPKPASVIPAPVIRAATRLAEAAAQASARTAAARTAAARTAAARTPAARTAAARTAAAPTGTPISPPRAAPSAHPTAVTTPDSLASPAPRPASGATPSGPRTASSAAAGRPPGGNRPGRSRLLIWAAGGLVLVLALTALFFLGRSLVGGDDAPAAVATPSATADPSAAPAAPAEATGPQPVGVHPWDTLFGGECLQPYTTPWEEEFTVADCATPHAAQLVYRGSFPGDAATAFPGEAELAGQINLLCSATGVIDLAAAGAYEDVQVQGSYPITEEQWAEGARYYYCFVSRASGEPLTASVAGPGPAPAA